MSKIVSDLLVGLIFVSLVVGCGIAAAVPVDGAKSAPDGAKEAAAAEGDRDGPFESEVVESGPSLPPLPVTTTSSEPAERLSPMSETVRSGEEVGVAQPGGVLVPPVPTSSPPPPTTTTTTSAPPNTQMSYRDMIAGWFPQWAREEAWRVMMCESGGDPDAHGDLHIPHRTDGLGSVGLFQINAGNIYGNPMGAVRAWQTNSGTEAVKILKDPATNVHMAYLIWKASGETFRRHWVNCTR